MGENSGIEWTDHTFNPWLGCSKVSPACANCYAEAWAKRTGHANLWRGHRRRTSVNYWHGPVAWNARLVGIRRRTGEERRERVFCASLADVFESPEGLSLETARTVASARADLWLLIERTPNLDWLLLTKRPENVPTMVPDRWNVEGFPNNVWVGTTVESQAFADERIPHLLKIPARVRFVSMEPLLGPVDLRRIGDGETGATYDALLGGMTGAVPRDIRGPSLSWVIAGGESGPKARASHPDWFRSLRDQCVAAGVPFLFKQWGEWAPDADGPPGRPRGPTVYVHGDPRHNERNVVTWQCPCTQVAMTRIGKAHAGRVLDGVTWDQVPLDSATQDAIRRYREGRLPHTLGGDL